ncbi:hypothetical protein N7471_010543 [Penicillium samsonianum]|uniref:uncharacterized protein n=1 Tax=Penicillium samsonianum TaxID=1882272 RepID=UPI00254990A3|nr:uncharacterized protein N7471_010543 [Penicillium samsonianum]KAJ6126050.1 hypothetical protein N7471_010543 [Penicillium samsonianum]
MATSEGGQALSAVPWDQRLRSEAQWRVWISHIESAATAEEVWEYMDPDLSDEKVSKPPVDSRKTFPQASEVKEGATDPSDLDEVQYLRFSRMVSLFEKERTFNNSIKKSIARINARILDCVSPEYHHILSDKKTAREKLVRLAQQFKPKGETRHQDLRNAWRYMLHTPIGKTSIERWLTNWSNLYDEAKSAEVPDICYRSTAHPEDRTAIRDFLQAVQPQDSYFSNHWRDKIQLPEVKMSFHEVLSAYRTHRSVQEQSKKGNSSAIAFAATLNGQQVLSNQKNHQQRCVCGSSRHHWKDCYHINASKRPPGWQQYEGSRKRVEDGIKKLSAVEQQEIAKMRSETSSLGKTAQLAITNESDVPIESMAFFSASISPAVCNAAMVFPLKSSWIVDSGANVHICNRRDRFEDLVEERRTVTLGTGGTITLGRGTAKVIIKNPTTGKILWGILQDVWYAPDFQTNVISVSEIKKNGFFFNSELPAITRDGKAVAICGEQDILAAMPWSVGEYEEERVVTGLEELTLTSPVTERREEDRKIEQGASKASKQQTWHSPAPVLVTPSPTISRDSTPVAAPAGSLPGAFPEERRVIGPPVSSNHLEAEGVRELNQLGEPDQQLQGDLQAVVSTPATPDVSESTVPVGYRRRGSLAPRDINASISESNIVTRPGRLS